MEEKTIPTEESVKKEEELKAEVEPETLQEIEAIQVVSTPPSDKKHKIKLKPAFSQDDEEISEIYTQYLAQKEQGKTSDALVTAVFKAPDSVTVADAVLKEMAEEAFVLKFCREQEEKNGGKLTAKIAHQRLQGLRAAGEIWFKRNELLGSKSIDLHSEQFKALYGLILEKIEKTLDDSGLGAYKAIFFHSLQINLNGWEAEAELVMAKVNVQAKKDMTKKEAI